MIGPRLLGRVGLRGLLRAPGCALFLLLIWAGTTDARVWRVRFDGTGDSTSILDTIEAAAEGDSIYIGPGDYRGEGILRFNKRLWVSGEGEGDERPILGQSSIYKVDEFALSRVRILGQPVGLLCQALRAVIEDCEFSYAPHGGLLCRMHVRVVGCTFVGNSIGESIGGGGAIQYYGEAHVDTQLEIENCTFVGNQAPDEGGAIWALPSPRPNSRVTIRNNLFVGNEATQGAAVYVEVNLAATRIENNTFIANTAQGSAVYVVGEVYINNNIFAYNDSFGYWCWGAGGASACGCNLFWENRSGGETQWGGECDWLNEVGLRDGEQILDPEFCNRQGDDWSLRPTSPGLPENFNERQRELGCEGRMGAFDVGCGFPPTVRTSWGELKQLLGGAEEGNRSGDPPPGDSDPR